MGTLLVIRGLMKNYHHTMKLKKHIMYIQLCVVTYIVAIKMTYGHNLRNPECIGLLCLGFMCLRKFLNLSLCVQRVLQVTACGHELMLTSLHVSRSTQSFLSSELWACR